MLDPEIHPRIRERIDAVEKGHGTEVMDRQVRVYCLLNKAAQKLKDMEIAQLAEGPGEARIVVNRAAKVIRGQAVRGHQDHHELLEVYTDLERLSKSIVDALGKGSSP